MASKRAKRQFHCQKCAAPCDIYKKGKAHRVLVCPNCGVIATNPKVFGGILKAFKGPAPGLFDKATDIIGLTSHDGRQPSPPPSKRTGDRFTSEERVALALR